MRLDSIEVTNKAGSGHPTSCASIAELFAILFFHPSGMKYNINQVDHFHSDRLILSKGHAAPILFSAWMEAGYFTKEEFLTMREFTSRLEGHPTPILPFVDVATGSLG